MLKTSSQVKLTILCQYITVMAKVFLACTIALAGHSGKILFVGQCLSFQAGGS